MSVKLFLFVSQTKLKFWQTVIESQKADEWTIILRIRKKLFQEISDFRLKTEVQIQNWISNWMNENCWRLSCLFCLYASKVSSQNFCILWKKTHACSIENQYFLTVFKRETNYFHFILYFESLQNWHTNNMLANLWKYSASQFIQEFICYCFLFNC